LIGFNLGASRPQKRWPTEHFIEAIKMQLSAGANIALLGGPGDTEAAEKILKATPSDRVIDLVGKTSIMELCAAIEECDVLISADTGAMHIAAAVGCPVVALFGSTDPNVSGPYRAENSRIIYKALSCAPCNSRPTCNGAFTCMREIAPAEVVAAANELLMEHGISKKEA
jgi:heptosyltransferase-1